MDGNERCPFCGGDARLEKTSISLEGGSALIHFSIRCGKCGATAPKADGYIALDLNYDGELNIWHDDRQEAWGNWNKRA